MSLVPGQRIGIYEVLAPVGAGAMGEVYRARDTRLQREVAIKVLPDSLAADEDRLRRFEREAKVLASLNHGNVAQIHGVEEAGGARFLVLELVPGESLAARLARGPLPVEEALDVCRQIAAGLEAAHEGGVIHRDLKPANVRLTPEGAVKVLDFGLAKSVKPRTTERGTSAAESDSFLLSEAGLVLGTPTYMSPEQARGKPVDRRTDIWAFGCVLHECLTGKRLFGGESVGEVLAAILHAEPDGSDLPSSTPPRVRELLSRCLVKDPRQRLRDIGDARLEIERAIAAREWAGAARSEGAGGVTGRPGRPLRLALGAAALLVAGAGAGRWLSGPPSGPSPPAPAQVFHLSLPFSPELPFEGLVGIAPDASFLVSHSSPTRWHDAAPTQRFLATRSLDREESRRIEGTEGAFSAALSRDGRSLAFFVQEAERWSGMTLKRIALEGGRPLGPASTVLERLEGRATACWAGDEEIVVAEAVPRGRILAAPARGGGPRVVVEDPPEEGKGMRGWWNPRPMPGGRSVLVTRMEPEGGSFRWDTELVDLATGGRKRVLERAEGALYVPTGHLLAFRDGTLLAVPFDLGRGETTGAEAAVLGGMGARGAHAPFVVSGSGVLALTRRPAEEPGRRTAWIDATGRAELIEGPAKPFDWAAISPDGRRFAYGIWDSSRSDPPGEFWVRDLERRTTTRLAIRDWMPSAAWSPDGERLTYVVGMGRDVPAFWERRADGTDEPALLHATEEAPIWVAPIAWSPDGNVFAFARAGFTGGENPSELWMLRRGEGGAPSVASRYAVTGQEVQGVAFSPDGRWICFGTSEEERQELCVQRFTGPGSGAEDARAGRWRISKEGGSAPWWSPDGKEIRFVDAGQRLVSVAVDAASSFSASAPRTLCELGPLRLWSALSYTADGRMLAILQGEGSEHAEVDVVLGFFEELKAKAPLPGR